MAEQPIPKKKRRQNVACDSCKLRCIKCDLYGVLLAALEDHAIDDPEPPLPLLVQQNREASCTNCKNKGLKCTTNSIENPTKPNKSGKRISQARRLFGKDAVRENNDDSGASAGIRTYDDLRDAREDIPSNISLAGYWASGRLPADHSSFIRQSIASGSSTPPNRSESPSFDYTILDHGPTFANASSSGSNVVVDPLQTWLALSDDPRKTAAGFAPPSLPQYNKYGTRATFSSLTQNEDDSGTPSSESTSGSEVVTMKQPFMSSLPFGNLKKAAMERKNLGLGPSYGNWPASTSGPSGSSSLLAKGKRKQTDYLFPAETRDPYHLWSVSKEIITWGRREEVQERLADRCLGQALSRHLVKSYFHAVHMTFPAVSPESFYLEWRKAGERSDRMTLAQEVLCSVIEAWGARYSDNPIVLGLTGRDALQAPKVFKEDGTSVIGGRDRAFWGRSRLPVCNALLDRVRRLMDYNGVLRRPSVTGVQALLLFNQLLEVTDQASKAADQYMQSQMIHSTSIEQMALLQLLWNSKGPIKVDETESHMSTPVLRLKQRRIFWTSIVTDSLWAAGSAHLPEIPEADVQAAGRWLSAVEAQLPPSTFRTLTFFLRCYHRLALLGRSVAFDLAIPNKRPGSVDVPEFCRKTREIWSKVKQLSRDVVVVTADMLPNCLNELMGFSPISYLSNLRLSCPFLLLLLHQVIRSQLDFRRDLSNAYIMDDTLGRYRSPEEGNLDKMQELHMQSVDILLQSCRGQMEVLQAMLPLGVIQNSAVFMRVLLSITQFLAEVPSNELGYPDNTMGGYGWDWEAKKREVGMCKEAMFQIGWAWSDVQPALDSVDQAMNRTTPKPEQIQEYLAKQGNLDPHIGERLEKEKMESKKAMDEVLNFWPPTSTPAMIDEAMKNLDLDSADTAQVLENLNRQHYLSALKTSPAILSDTSADGGLAAGSINAAGIFMQTQNAAPGMENQQTDIHGPVQAPTKPRDFTFFGIMGYVGENGDVNPVMQAAANIDQGQPMDSNEVQASISASSNSGGSDQPSRGSTKSPDKPIPFTHAMSDGSHIQEGWTTSPWYGQTGPLPGPPKGWNAPNAGATTTLPDAIPTNMNMSPEQQAFMASINGDTHLSNNVRLKTQSTLQGPSIQPAGYQSAPQPQFPQSMQSNQTSLPASMSGNSSLTSTPGSGSSNSTQPMQMQSQTQIPSQQHPYLQHPHPNPHINTTQIPQQLESVPELASSSHEPSSPSFWAYNFLSHSQPMPNSTGNTAPNQPIQNTSETSARSSMSGPANMNLSSNGSEMPSEINNISAFFNAAASGGPSLYTDQAYRERQGGNSSQGSGETLKQHHTSPMNGSNTSQAESNGSTGGTGPAALDNQLDSFIIDEEMQRFLDSLGPPADSNIAQP